MTKNKDQQMKDMEKEEMKAWELQMQRYMLITNSRKVNQYNQEMTELEANLAKGTAKFGRN